MELEPRHVKPVSAPNLASAYMTTGERFWWVVCNVFTLGYFWLRKVTMKRAFLEALIAHDRLRAPVPYPASSSAPVRSPYAP